MYNISLAVKILRFYNEYVIALLKRYHKPRTPSNKERKRGEDPIAIVKMQNPRLFLTCHGDNLAARCPDRTVTTFCDSSGTAKKKKGQQQTAAITSQETVRLKLAFKRYIFSKKMIQ